MIKSLIKISEEELRDILIRLELNKKKNIFIASDLGNLGLIKNKNYTVDFIFNTILNLNPNLNIVVPTANFNLIDRNEVFNINDTKSYRMGPISEKIRLQKKAIRSFHPIWSLSGIGPDINDFLKNISKHGYDTNSVFSKMFKNDFFFLSLGKHPRFMLSIIHHLEHTNKVPYRFQKAFNIKYLNEGKIIEDDFYLDVLKDEYRDKPRARNKKIFETFESNFELIKFQIGVGMISIFSFNDFKKSTDDLMKKDNFCWFK